MIEINPDALTIAARLDTEGRQQGPRGPLHGVLVIVKESIDTASKMTTTSSLAMLGNVAPRDAFLVERTPGMELRGRLTSEFQGRSD